VYTSTDLETWTLVASNLNHIRGICYNDNLQKFVMTSYYNSIGRILISNDGIEWEQVVQTDIEFHLRSCIFDNTLQKFCVFGSSGYFAISENGYNWQVIDTGFSITIKYVLYNNNTYYLSLYSMTAKSFYEGQINIISTITSDSDMNLGIETGNNTLVFTYDEGLATATISYRQKYIGV